MVKGRRFNPPLDKDGRWFPHIGLTQKMPESITSTMLKESHSPRLSRQVEEKLPPIYKLREKQAVNNNFPFSAHDNRHSFQDSGFYLDSADLGSTERQVPALEDPDSRNGAAVVGSVEKDTGKGVPPQFVQWLGTVQ
ncbi:hypothetical protein MJG53_018503 [Ovis ammon polii x Ovis aries]|uniref:Uncharacterized protein n=1 Tax=Ovis ammon polii x Ovis aries TaxID=2918886 RepID=A0ACB9U3X6_9CETA|nr:hypothetical protein MJG53_018503 [Ovis ammon polii x Ovis aries]